MYWIGARKVEAVEVVWVRLRRMEKTCRVSTGIQYL